MGYALRLSEDSRKAMTYYFVPEDLGNVVKNCEAIPVKQFASIDELNNLLIIAQDKKQWESLINVICFAKDE